MLPVVSCPRRPTPTIATPLVVGPVEMLTMRPVVTMISVTIVTLSSRGTCITLVMPVSAVAFVLLVHCMHA